jgi:hypothetical protein
MKYVNILDFSSFHTLFSTSDFAEFCNIFWNYGQLLKTELAQKIYASLSNDSIALFLTEQEIKLLLQELQQLKHYPSLKLPIEKYSPYLFSFLSQKELERLGYLPFTPQDQAFIIKCRIVHQRT